jgi:TonB family protein
MTEDWKRWEGRVLDGKLPLAQYLGGSEHSAVFLTERSEPGPARAAVKLVRAKKETAGQQLERWERAADLSHPNLLRILQWGRCELDSTPLLYVVMEYADENLGQILPQRALSPEEARALLPPALDALTYLHARGFVHGAIQPSNILAVGDQLKLSSDGLVKSREPRLAPLNPYSAPEAGTAPVLPAEDSWSLGMVLVQGLTQRMASNEASPSGDPVVLPTIPAPLFEIARNCLRVDPQKRWTPADIVPRLRPEPVARPATPARSPARLPFAINWQYAVPLGIIAIVLVIAIIVRMNRTESDEGVVFGVVQQPQAQAAPEANSAKPPAAQAPPRAEKKLAAPPSPAPAPVKPRPVPANDGAPANGVVHQVIPSVPQSARNTITGKVRVRVRVSVDAAGNVTETTLDSAGPSKYFARLATEAAQQWKFAPAPSASVWTIRFAFGRSGTEVYPQRSPH